MPIDFKEIRELLGAIAQTDITELTLKNEDFELIVRKGANLTNITVGENIVAPLPATSSTPSTIQKPAIIPSSSLETSVPPPTEKKGVPIPSPMVGTFYRAPSPDEAPYVEVGQSIGKGNIVCIIEAMKLMNEIEADVSGIITEILVENGQPVEYGQTLMWIKTE